MKKEGEVFLFTKSVVRDSCYAGWLWYFCGQILLLTPLVCICTFVLLYFQVGFDLSCISLHFSRYHSVAILTPKLSFEKSYQIKNPDICYAIRNTLDERRRSFEGTPESLWLLSLIDSCEFDPCLINRQENVIFC